MSTTKSRVLAAGGALLAALSCSTVTSPTPAQASACSDLPATLTSDPLTAGGFEVVGVDNLSRTQARPWQQIPTGARLFVRAPAGITEADLHRAATCSASEGSPMSVPGARLEVSRQGGVYVLDVTAPARSAALEIQRRAKAL